MWKHKFYICARKNQNVKSRGHSVRPRTANPRTMLVFCSTFFSAVPECRDGWGTANGKFPACASSLWHLGKLKELKIRRLDFSVPEGEHRRRHCRRHRHRRRCGSFLRRGRLLGLRFVLLCQEGSSRSRVPLSPLPRRFCSIRRGLAGRRVFVGLGR